jgi:4-hydroxy-3-polyprenylbenzoate decarboxylase
MRSMNVVSTEPARMVIGITGATGIVYGVRTLEALRSMGIETHLVVSKAGEMTRVYETEYSASQLKELADFTYAPGDIAAPISSGSFRTLGMIIAPCSVRTMSDIAHGVTSGLISRAADVCLKERRRLVLLFRETPLHSGHLRNLLAITDMGGIVAPPVPAFYSRPRTLDDIIAHSVGRVLDLFGLDTKAFPRWGETRIAQEAPMYNDDES